MRKLPALSAMKIFEVVGQTRSFTRAAERLNLTQSAVSRQVRNLEDQLGETLVLRKHHHLELTASGAELLEALQHAFEGVELAVRNIAEKNNKNRLRINAPPTFARRWLVPRLESLRSALPGIDISITTELQDSLAESGMLDCAIRFGDGEWPLLRSQLLMTERHIAVCAPSLLATGPDAGTLNLSSLPFLHVLASSDQRYLTWQRWLDAAGLSETQTECGLEFDLLDMAIEAACCGLGVTVADRFMVDPLIESNALTQVMDVEVEGHESYWLVTRAGQTETASVKALHKWLFAQVQIASTHIPLKAR